MSISKKNRVVLITTTILVVTGGLFYLHQPTEGLDEFVVLTREDPLFYSPFFDTDAFSKAVDELKVSEKNLKETVLNNISSRTENYVESYTNLIQNNPLFPTNFLALLPEISIKTEDLIALPTPQKARQLLELYEQAQKVYEKDAQSMTKAFATIDGHIPNDRPVYYFFINSATSVRLAQNNFNLIYKNSLALKEEIDRRHDCLSGKNSCEIIRPKSNNTYDLKKRTTPVVPTSANANFILTTLPFASSTREIHGPYPISSTCWGSSSMQPMYAVYSTNEKGEKTILPKLAQENYYNLVAPQAVDTVSKKLREMGLQFYGQAEGTTYECSDLTFYPNILTLDFIHSRTNTSPQADFEDSEYIQLWNNKFGLLAPALQSLASFTNLLEVSQRIGNDFVLSPQFLFTTRSAYSITYLPFAQSVWRIDEQLQFLLSQDEFDRLGAPQQFKSLTQLKQGGYTEAQIQKSHINQKEFIESLVE